jgi:hypothetical protein
VSIGVSLALINLEATLSLQSARNYSTEPRGNTNPGGGHLPAQFDDMGWPDYLLVLSPSIEMMNIGQHTKPVRCETLAVLFANPYAECHTSVTSREGNIARSHTLFSSEEIQIMHARRVVGM